MKHLHLEGCVVDLTTGTVRADTGTHTLTEVEHKLLAHLAAASGRPVDRDELLAEVWGIREAVVTRCVDTAVRRLRVKIEADPSEPRHLLKVHGLGYRLDVRGPPPEEVPVEAPALEVDPWPLFGREDALAWLGRALRSEAPRIAVAGPPGSGRRRLVLEAARRHGGVFPGGVWRGRRGAGEGRALIVLPEEDVGAGDVALVLGPEPGAEVLHIGGLDLAAAVALLEDRAGPVELAEELVEAVDRLPLGIVEVAQRVRLLGAADVLARIDDPAMLPELRRRTEAELPEGEALARCAVFRSAFGTEACEALGVSLEQQLDLIDRGLLVREPGRGPARLRVPNTVRRVVGGDRFREEHLRWMLAWGERQHAAYRGDGVGQARAAVLEALPDVELALETAVGSDPVAAVRLLVVLDGPLQSRGLHQRAEALHDRVIGCPLPPLWRSRLLQLRCEARRMRGSLAGARDDAEQALIEARASGDEVEQGMARAVVALVDHTVQALDAAEAGYREAIEQLRAAGEEHFQATWLGNLGRLLTHQGRHAEAEPILRRVVELRQRSGGTAALARARDELATLLVDLGLHGEAERLLDRAHEAWQRLGDRPMATLGALQRGLLCLDAGRPEAAVVALEEAVELGVGRNRALARNYLGVARWRVGDPKQAERDLREAVEQHAASETPVTAGPALLWLALFEAAHGRLREAEASLARARALAPSERGLEPLVEVVREVALARRKRTGGSAVLRARGALAALEEAAATDAELRVALRLVSAWLDQRSSATTGQ